MPKVTTSCLECGAEFMSYASANRQYCSRDCILKAQSRGQRNGTWFRPIKTRRGTETPCAACGKPVYANASQRAKGQGRFCSVECMGKGYTKPAVIKACAVCGKEVSLTPSRGGTFIYCSKVCESHVRTKRPLDRIHNGKAARKDSKGYVMVYESDHPNKSFHGWQYEHRLVAESVLGRYLASDEHVHHINGIKDDNRPTNLEVMTANDHAALSSQDYRDSINRQLEELAEYKRRHGPLTGG